MNKIILEKHKIPNWKGSCTYTPISKSLPFFYSKSGEYAHRVRSAVIIKLGDRQPHIAYRCWCGMSLCFSRDRFAILSNDPDGRPICATCEGRAYGAGVLGKKEIAGKAVMFRPRIFS